METTELALFTRGVRDAAASATGAELDAALGDLGWHDALAADDRAAVSVLFECQGAANVTSSALDRVLGGALGLAADPRSAPVVLPALGEVAPPGAVSGGHLLVRGLALAAVTSHPHAVVVAPAGNGDYEAVAVPLSALTLRAVDGLDPGLGLREVSGDVETAAGPSLGRVDWERAVALGQLALGYELLGAGRTMLELARQHALDRVQFGRPIGSFQAVRHRLAESLVALEAAAALLDAAWEDPATYAAMAKSFTGRQVRVAGRHCQQVLAGIGFTTEHPFHRFLRRTIVLDQLLGAGTALTRRLGADVLATGSLPPAFAL